VPTLDRVALLHSLLLTPGIQRGLIPRPTRRIATGRPDLDALLQGGVPAGAITAVGGPRSSGKTALGYAVIAGLTAAGSAVAWVDVGNAFDPEHAAAAGIRLQHVLWIRPPDVRVGLRATEHVLETGGFALVLLDLDDEARPRPMSRTTSWLRLTRTVATSSAAVLVITASAADVAAAVCLETTVHTVSFIDATGPQPLFDGIVSVVECRKNKLGPTSAAGMPLRAAAG
jgi:hypothetical protein